MGFFLVFAGFDLKSLVQQETLPIELIKTPLHIQIVLKYLHEYEILDYLGKIFICFGLTCYGLNHLMLSQLAFGSCSLGWTCSHFSQGFRAR